MPYKNTNNRIWIIFWTLDTMCPRNIKAFQVSIRKPFWDTNGKHLTRFYRQGLLKTHETWPTKSQTWRDGEKESLNRKRFIYRSRKYDQLFFSFPLILFTYENKKSHRLYWKAFSYARNSPETNNHNRGKRSLTGWGSNKSMVSPYNTSMTANMCR